MKTGFKIALPMLALVVGAGLGQAHKHIRMANAKARLAQEQSDRAQEQSDKDALAQELSDKDAKDAQACRDVGGMPIYSVTWRLAGCYQPLRKK